MRVLVSRMVLAVAVAGPGCRQSPPAPAVREPLVATTVPARFDFHSGAWVNLHNILYGEGLKRLGHPTRGGGGGHGGSDGLETIDVATLRPSELSAWDAAIAFYASAYGERDPLFDDELVDVANKLSALEGSSAVTDAGLPAALVGVLDQAMPVYRAHWWTEHDRENHAWISSIQPYVERSGAAVSRELLHSYQTEWPKEPIRVDVSHYVYFAGAYTTLGPAHITMSSSDDRNQAPGGFESLFHEASHIVIRPVRDALTRELAAQGKSSRDLWHVLLFFSAGDAVKHQLTGYVPYAYKFGLYEGRWAPYRSVLEQRWTPYLEGRVSFDAAIHEIVGAL